MDDSARNDDGARQPSTIGETISESPFPNMASDMTPDMVVTRTRSRTASMGARNSFPAWNKRSSISSNKITRSRQKSDASSMTRGLAVTNHLSIFAGLDEDETSEPQQFHTDGPKSPPIDPLMSKQHGESSKTPQEQSKRNTPLRKRITRAFIKYTRFIGPGALVSVAYMDPGNYATDLAAGATYQFKLLYIILISTIFAIFLQSLSVKLGSVTGLNLAQMIKLHTPWWLNIILYLFAEVAIIATDVSEVIGTAIALNLLFKLPLVAGCAISILDVLLILFLYRPGGSIRGLRAFEFFVLFLVLGVVVCFCMQLSMLKHTALAEVLQGYLPSKSLFEQQAIYQACGIIGATVMPHSLYLGSGTCLPRMLHYDKRQNKVRASTALDPTTTGNSHRSHRSKSRFKSKSKSNPSTTASTISTFSLPPILAPLRPLPTHYAPSLSAIRYCLRTSIAELSVSLATLALFVNSAILIVAGASLYSPSSPSDSAAASASLFHVHDLLSKHIAPSAGTLFALSLLLSGISAGIVCTISGQMVSEAQLKWRVAPWVRRLVTRSISIAPSVVIAGAVGQQGLSRALEASQVVLCFCLPMVIAPLVWFTARAEFCGVKVGPNGERVLEGEREGEEVAKGEGEKKDVVRVEVREVQDRPVGLGVLGESIELEVDGGIRAEQRGKGKDEGEGAGSASAQVKSHGMEGAIAPWTDDERSEVKTVQFRNHWGTTGFAILIWIIIVCMNMTTVVFLAMGKGKHDD